MEPKEFLKEDVPYVPKCTCNLPAEKVKATLIGDKESISQENIGDSILNALKSKPNFIGQVDADKEEEITFEQMRQNSVKCALWLKKVGVKKGDVIAICTRNPSIVYVPFLASIYIGAIVNPWEEHYFKDIFRVMFFLLQNEPDVIFVDADNFVDLLLSVAILKAIEKTIKIVPIDEIKSSIKFNSLESILNDNFDKAEIDNFSCEKIDVMDTAITTFSSIKQTYPGHVQVPYIAFISPSNKQTPVMSPGDVGLWYESLCWTHGPLLTVHAILSYVTAIKSAVPSERNLYETIQKYKVTWMFLTSDMCNQLFQSNDDFTSEYNIFSLKTLLFDNRDMRYIIYQKLFLKLPYASIVQVYSKPETGVIAYREDTEILCGLMNYCIGSLTKNVQLVYLNSEMKELGPNDPGLIYCKTPYTKLCRRHKTKELWYRAGDAGCYNKDFQAFLFHEKENCYYVRYKRILLVSQIIEDILKCHPAVSEVIVKSVPHSIDNEHPVAFVQKKPGAKVTKKELIEFVAKTCDDQNLEHYNLRGGVHFITYEIPRLPNGKIYRRCVN